MLLYCTDKGEPHPKVFKVFLYGPNSVLLLECNCLISLEGGRVWVLSGDTYYFPSMALSLLLIWAYQLTELTEVNWTTGKNKKEGIALYGANGLSYLCVLQELKRISRKVAGPHGHREVGGGQRPSLPGGSRELLHRLSPHTQLHSKASIQASEGKQRSNTMAETAMKNSTSVHRKPHHCALFCL